MARRRLLVRLVLFLGSSCLHLEDRKQVQSASSRLCRTVCVEQGYLAASRSCRREHFFYISFFLNFILTNDFVCFVSSATFSLSHQFITQSRSNFFVTFLKVSFVAVSLIAPEHENCWEYFHFALISLFWSKLYAGGKEHRYVFIVAV